MRGLHATHVVIGERGDNRYKGSVKVGVKSDTDSTAGFAALGIHRLLKARAVTNYLAPGPSNSLTEKVVRPLFWMLSRHYEDRIPEVEGIEPAAKNGTNRFTAESRVSVTNPTSEQPDNTYVVARLKRDDPALAQQVIAGEITANAAAIASGIRKPYARHRTDDPNLAIQSLLRHYTREQLTAALLGGEA